MTTPWAYKNPNQTIELLKRTLLTDSIRWDSATKAFHITYASSDPFRSKGAKGDHLFGQADIDARIAADSALLNRYLDIQLTQKLVERAHGGNTLILRPDDCIEDDFKRLVSDSDSLTRRHNAQIYFRGY